MYKKILFITLILFTVHSMSAQQPNQVQRGQRGYVPQPKNFTYKTPVSIKKPIQETEKILLVCKEKFQLDDFESEILKGMTMRKIENDNAILLNKDFDASQRQKSLIASDKNYFQQLLDTGIFTKEEVETMKLIDFDGLEKEDKKKRKKKKRRNKKTL